jgi:pimeloyl-ACP methyl ester carboxylesterase
MPSTVALSDVRICLEMRGEGGPLLLLHGFPASGRLWDLVTPALARSGHCCIVPDLIGYGSSVAPAGVRVDMLSQSRWLWQLMEKLDVARPVIIAHDVGSAAAQLMAVAHPARVRALVILDGVYEGEWAMQAVTSIRDWNPAEAARLQPVLLRRLGKSPELRAMLGEYAGEDGARRLIRAARDLDPAQTLHLSARLGALRIPALVLWGRDDPYLPIDTVARPLARLLNAPLQLLPGAHFTPLDCPHEVTAALQEFLAQLP